jgi:sortase A
MGRKTLKKTLSNTLIVLGVMLLGVYLLVRGLNQSGSAAGLEAFEQARADRELPAAGVQGLNDNGAVSTQPQMARADRSDSHPPARVTPAERPIPTVPRPVSLETVPEPDFDDWSEKRIAEYKESLEAASDLPLAVLSIDHLDIRVPVFNGASDLNLNRGVARIKGTARLGEESNLGIAGHRDGFFRGLQHITVGDPIDLETLSGQTRYRVTGIQIVYPEDVHVLQPTDSSTLTLVTCYPFYFVGSAPQRYIVTAEAEPVQVRS